MSFPSPPAFLPPLCTVLSSTSLHITCPPFPTPLSQLGLRGDLVHTPGGLPTILAPTPDPDVTYDHGGPVPV